MFLTCFLTTGYETCLNDWPMSVNVLAVRLKMLHVAPYRPRYTELKAVSISVIQKRLRFGQQWQLQGWG